MPEIPLTRVAALVPFPRFLAAGGCDVVSSMQRAGLAPELLRTPEVYVPLRRAAGFINRIERREGIDCLGLLVGARSSLSDLGRFGRLLSNSLTLKDSLRRIVRYVPEVDTGARAWREQVPERDAVRLCIRHQVDLGKSLIDGYGLMILLNAVRHATGREWRPSHLRLNADCRRVRDRIEVLSEAQVETGVDHAAFEIPRRLLPNRFGRAMHGGAVDSESRWSGPPSGLAAVLSAVIRGSFGSRLPDMMELSELAGVSVRTLQRQLGDEGYRFRELLDELRFKEARARLADPLLPVAEISRHLGFPDPANFTHAFRRWTGESPTTYRKRITA